MARLKLVQSGKARERVSKGITPPDKRLPITVQILRGLVQTWTPAPTDGGRAPARYVCILLRSAAALCFFGFFRSTSGSILHGETWLQNDASPPASLRIRLKRSKCNQMGLGVDIYVGRTGTEICPVSLTLQYVMERGPSRGPFFRLQDRTPLTKGFFVTKVRHALSTLGVQPQCYAGQSFRIDAAMAAAQAGLGDSVIQSLGRWSSTAFRRCIRTPQENLASFSRELVEQNRDSRNSIPA
jgi:hypothetical protein